MIKIVNLNNLCDAISDPTLDDDTRRVIVGSKKGAEAYAVSVFLKHFGAVADNAEVEPVQHEPNNNQ